MFHIPIVSISLQIIFIFIYKIKTQNIMIIEKHRINKELQTSHCIGNTFFKNAIQIVKQCKSK